MSYFEENEEYYRIYLNSDNKLSVITMQSFDECDYNKDDFMTDEDGDRLKFEEKKEAVKWLFENVKEEYIEDEYKKPGFNRDRYLK